MLEAPSFLPSVLSFLPSLSLSFLPSFQFIFTEYLLRVRHGARSCKYCCEPDKILVIVQLKCSWSLVREEKVNGYTGK